MSASPVALNLRLLPPQLRELVRTMGEADAFRLVERRGGTTMRVPKRVSTRHWLLQIVSPQAFAQLVDGYAGMEIQLPKYDSVLRQIRHQRVHHLLSRHTVSEVALLTNYTTRQVFNIKRAAGVAAGAAMPQRDLFADA